MSWHRIDDGLPEHPKLEALERDPRLWADALALWLAAGCYCRRAGTGGFVSDKRLERLTPLNPRRIKRVAKALVEEARKDPDGAGLWHEVEGGYQFHDWEDYGPRPGPPPDPNPTPEAERARKYRRKRRNGDRDGSRDGYRDGSADNRHATDTGGNRDGPSRDDSRARTRVPGPTQLTPLTPPVTVFGQIEAGFRDFRRRTTGKSWRRSMADYAKCELAAEVLGEESERSGESVEALIGRSLAAFGADKGAKEAGYPFAFWANDVGKWLAKADAARAATGTHETREDPDMSPEERRAWARKRNAEIKAGLG